MVKPRSATAAQVASVDDEEFDTADSVETDAGNAGSDASEPARMVPRRGGGSRSGNAETVPQGTAFDLSSSMDFSGTARLELVLPDGEPALDPETGDPVWIELYSRDSDAYQTAQRSIVNRRTMRAQRRALLVEENLAESISVLSQCTVRWQHIAVDGKVLDCRTPQETRTNAKLIYERFPFVREQVDAFIHNRANFMKR